MATACEFLHSLFHMRVCSVFASSPSSSQLYHVNRHHPLPQLRRLSYIGHDNDDRNKMIRFFSFDGSLVNLKGNVVEVWRNLPFIRLCCILPPFFTHLFIPHALVAERALFCCNHSISLPEPRIQKCSGPNCPASQH